MARHTTKAKKQLCLSAKRKKRTFPPSNRRRRDPMRQTMEKHTDCSDPLPTVVPELNHIVDCGPLKIKEEIDQDFLPESVGLLMECEDVDGASEEVKGVKVKEEKVEDSVEPELTVGYGLPVTIKEEISIKDELPDIDEQDWQETIPAVCNRSPSQKSSQKITKKTKQVKAKPTKGLLVKEEPSDLDFITNENPSTMDENPGTTSVAFVNCGQTTSAATSYRIENGQLFPVSNTFDCSICGESFLDKEALVIHTSLHRKNRDEITKWKCKRCEMTFNYKAALFTHVKTHGNLKQHECECGKSYSRKEDLIAHRRWIHNGVKLYSCSLCSSTFTRSRSLPTHLRRIHGVSKKKQTQNSKAKLSTENNEETV